MFFGLVFIHIDIHANEKIKKMERFTNGEIEKNDKMFLKPIIQDQVSYGKKTEV